MRAGRVLVWDLPTRLFHWLLVASFAGAWITGESDDWIDLHATFGYTVAGLIAFRLAWGFAGTRYARFASFVTGAAPVVRYLRSLLTRRPEHHVGHNPAAGWAILALLALGTLATLTGYAALGEGEDHWLEEIHEGAAHAFLALVFVHVGAAIGSSFVHRENLVRAMWDGHKRGTPGEAIRRAGWVGAAVLLTLVAGIWAAALRAAPL